jgi:hypothetical protein
MSDAGGRGRGRGGRQPGRCRRDLVTAGPGVTVCHLDCHDDGPPGRADPGPPDRPGR